ncbi:MAG: EamA family transporter [Candidatus Altiarchaeota archaeon]|nr:EamA family transporter [Candidatus Altiarchaeota archaeon]
MVTYLIMAVLSMIFFGITHFIRKIGLPTDGNMLPYLLIENLIVLVATGLIFLAYKNHEFPALKYPVLSGLAATIALVFFLGALSRGPISVVSPITSSNLLIAVLLGIFLLGESITLFKGAGIALILAGIFMLQM